MPSFVKPNETLSVDFSSSSPSVALDADRKPSLFDLPEELLSLFNVYTRLLVYLGDAGTTGVIY